MVTRLAILLAVAVLSARASVWSVTNDVAGISTTAVSAAAGEIRVTVAARAGGLALDLSNTTSQWTIVDARDGETITNAPGRVLDTTGGVVRFSATLPAGTFRATATVHPAIDPAYTIDAAALTVTSALPFTVQIGGGTATNLDASAITSGTIDTNRLPLVTTNMMDPAAHALYLAGGGGITNGQHGVTLTGSFAGNASGLTNVDATNIVGIIPQSDTNAFAWIVANGMARTSNNTMSSGTTLTTFNVTMHTNSVLSMNGFNATLITNGTVKLATRNASLANNSSTYGGIVALAGNDVTINAANGGNAVVSVNNATIGNSAQYCLIGASGGGATEWGRMYNTILSSSASTLGYVQDGNAMLACNASQLGNNDWNTGGGMNYNVMLSSRGGYIRGLSGNGEYNLLASSQWGLITGAYYAVQLGNYSNRTINGSFSLSAASAFVTQTGAQYAVALGAYSVTQNATRVSGFGLGFRQLHNDSFVWSGRSGSFDTTAAGQMILMPATAAGVSIGTNATLGTLYVAGTSYSATSTVTVTTTNYADTTYTNASPYLLELVASVTLTNDGVGVAAAALEVGGVIQSEVSMSQSGTNRVLLSGWVSQYQTWSVTNLSSGGSVGLTRVSLKNE